MFDDNSGHDGLPKANPKKLFGTIVVLAILMYTPFVIAVYGLHDENYKQLKAEGLSLLNLQHYERSIAVWNKLLKAYPGDVDGYLGLGIAYTQMGDYDTACVVFDEALARHPDDKRLLYNKALMYMNQGDYDQARKGLESLKTLDDMYPELHFHLGKIAEDEGDFSAARDLYIAELNVNAACAKAWYRLEVLRSNGLLPE